MRQLAKASKTIVLSSGVSAGVDGAFVTTVPEIDMKGFDSAEITVVLGTIATDGVFTMRVKNSATSATYGSGTIDRIGSNMANTADTQDGKALMFEVHRPKRRFLRLEYQRTVGNVTIQAIIVKLYNAHQQPVAKDTSILEVQSLSDPTPLAV